MKAWTPTIVLLVLPVIWVLSASAAFGGFSVDVLLATHRRFKGLEADALVLAGIPEPGSSKYYSKADHYVASSRAKHVLAVVRT